MKKNLFVAVMALPLIMLPGILPAQAPSLGAASGFALFTASGAFSNVGGATNVTGNIGTNSGTLTGFPPGILNGTAYVANVTSAQVATDVSNAYSSLNSVACGSVIGTSLGGVTLTPNVYCINASASLSGTLTLNGQGNPNALFIIKVNGTLTTASSSNVNLVNGASACNVYWQVNGAVTLGNNSNFRGTILASNKLDLLIGASLFGRGLTTNGAVTLKNNTANLGIPPPASTITASGATSFCTGGSVILTGNSGGSWNTGSVAPSLTVSTGGNFFVTNTSGCITIPSNTISVTVNPSPILSVHNETVCEGNSVLLSAFGADTYSWSGNSLSSTTGSIVTASPTVNSIYTVTGTSSLGCVASATASVTVYSNPTIIVNSASICAGGIATLMASGASTYTWSPSIGLSSSTGSSVNANPSSTTTYTISGTNANGCEASAISSVVINSNPTITVNSATICAGDNAILSASGASGYTWSPGSATGATVNVNPSSTVVYTVTGSNSAGCIGSASSTVVVNPLPTASIVAGGPTTFCQGDSVILTANAATSYSWSTAAITQSISVNTSGNYFVTVTDLNGCSNTSSVIPITVNPLPSASINANGPTTFCQGGSVILTANAATSYSWSTAAITQSISVNISGNYFVTVTDLNGCSNTSSVIPVTVNPLPSASINANGPTTFCQGGSVILTANAATSYSWSTAATTQSISVNTSGNYFVTVTDLNGCSNTSSVIPVTVNPLPSASVSANGPTTFCQGGSVILSANAANSYSWSTAATTQSINVNTTGNYSVTVTDGNGCMNTASMAVMVLPNPTITVNSATLCSGNSAMLLANGASTYTWQPSSLNGNTVTVNPSSTTLYTVTGTSSAGCISSATTVVSVNPNPTVNVSSSPSTIYLCYGPNSSTLTSNTGGGTGPYTYTWSTGSNNSSTLVTPTLTSDYTLTIQDTKGCSASAQISVNVINACCGNNSNNPKVIICHNGHQQCVSPNAVPAFLSQGDQIGPCTGGSRFANTSITEDVETMSEVLVYPNPFNSSVNIRISSANQGNASIIIRDLNGKVVAKPFNGTINPGENMFSWSPYSDHISSGIYFCEITGPELSKQIKLIITD